MAISKFRLALAVLAGLMLGGCGTDYSYKNVGANNLHIKSDIVDGGFGTTYSVWVYVYETDGKCLGKYLGFLKPDYGPQKLEAGLPLGKPVAIEVKMNIEHGESNKITEKHDYLVQPGPADHYYIDTTLKNSFFKQEFSQGRSGGGRQKVQEVDLSKCKQG